MDWTKIKTKHFLLTDMSLLERGALATILCLTAHKEVMPTPADILQVVPEATYRGVCNKLTAPLQGVLEKVLEDVEQVHHKRGGNKKRQQKYRAREESNALPDSVTVTAQIREDKIREDKIREDKGFKKPTLSQVNAFIKENNYTSVNASAFINFYDSNGWRVGKNKMKCWKSAVRGWHSRDNNDKKTGGMDDVIEQINS